jgi:hypothetical protein
MNWSYKCWCGGGFVAVIDDAFGGIDLGEMAVEVVFERGHPCCIGKINAALGVEAPKVYALQENRQCSACSAVNLEIE